MSNPEPRPQRTTEGKLRPQRRRLQQPQRLRRRPASGSIATECGANSTSGFFRPSRPPLRVAAAGPTPVWPLRVLEGAHRAIGILRRRSRWSQPWSKIVSCGVRGSLYCLRLKARRDTRPSRGCHDLAHPLGKNPFDLDRPGVCPAPGACAFSQFGRGRSEDSNLMYGGSVGNGRFGPLR